MFDDFYTKAAELIRRGVPFATAIVVRAERPTSGKPGDKAIITADGTLYGWIGGSCAQPAVAQAALAALHEDQSRLVRLSPDPTAQPPREGVIDVPMVCFSGGTIEIFVEPHHPRPRLLVVGALPTARALAQLGRALNYHVTLIDPDHQGESPAEADELFTELDAIPAASGPLTYAVVATHGHYDEPALERLLATRAPYVALVASRRRAEEVRSFLAGQGLTNEQIARLRAPAGLDIGARRGDEIALSIMAEIIQARRSADQPGHELMVEAAASAPALQTAIDPVCGMTVEIAGAKHMYVYQGVDYYFCCPGCRRAFIETPEQYLAAAPDSGGE